MEMKLDGDRFWILENRQTDETLLYDEKEEGVRTIRDLIQDDASSDDLDLLEVQVHDDEFEIRGVPWSDIAELLV